MKRRDWGIAGAWAAIVAAGLWPHLFAIGLWPTSRDAALWIVRGAFGRPGWLAWVFATQHFVGYRPVAALSYTLDSIAFGFAAWPYRATDLALHAACALFVYLLYRRITPALPLWGGLVASALFVAHPVVAEVVPHLARRSYSLATLFGLAAACAALRFRAVLSGVLVALAVLANEVAFATIPMVAVFSWLGARRRGETSGASWVAAAGPAAAGIVALLLRVAVVGGVGGYATGLDRGERVVAIVVATWRTLLSFSTSGTLQVCAAGIAGYYLIRAASGTAGWIAALMVGWLLLYTMLFAPLGVWFPRQTYPVLAPFALLVGVVLADTRRMPRASLTLHLVPQAALAVWILLHSPVVLGPDPARVAAWRQTDALLRSMHQDLTTLASPVTVRLATPYYESEEVEALRARERGRQPPQVADLPVVWLGGLLGDKGIAVGPLVAYEKTPGEPPGGCRLTESGGTSSVEIDRNRTFWILAPDAVVERTAEAIRVSLDPRTAVGTRLYVHDGGSGTLSGDR